MLICQHRFYRFDYFTSIQRYNQLHIPINNTIYFIKYSNMSSFKKTRVGQTIYRRLQFSYDFIIKKVINAYLSSSINNLSFINSGKSCF